MDKEEGKGNAKWSWLPSAMPGVDRLMKEKRRLHGDAHVNECWKRGVVAQEPGWFFAREGALAVGTPWCAAPDLQTLQVTRTQALLMLREPGKGGHDGAH